MNEKFAPELLESKADLVECMLDQIKEMASLEFQCIIHSQSPPAIPQPTESVELYIAVYDLI